MTDTEQLWLNWAKATLPLWRQLYDRTEALIAALEQAPIPEPTPPPEPSGEPVFTLVPSGSIQHPAGEPLALAWTSQNVARAVLLLQQDLIEHELLPVAGGSIEVTPAQHGRVYVRLTKLDGTEIWQEPLNITVTDAPMPPPPNPNPPPSGLPADLTGAMLWADRALAASVQTIRSGDWSDADVWRANVAGLGTQPITRVVNPGHTVDGSGGTDE